MDAILAEWSALDHEACLFPADHRAVGSTSAVRALILELVRSEAPARELLTACAVLGRLVAEHGGSPTLAASTIDGAVAVLRLERADVVATMRAAVAEGFHAAALEAAEARADARWEYPGCAVTLEGGAVAIAGGYPEDDGEALAAWASRVASAAARGGMRRAIVSGGSAARHALADALTLVGIQVRVSTPPPAPRRR